MFLSLRKVDIRVARLPTYVFTKEWDNLRSFSQCQSSAETKNNHPPIPITLQRADGGYCLDGRSVAMDQDGPWSVYSLFHVSQSTRHEVTPWTILSQGGYYIARELLHRCDAPSFAIIASQR